MDKPAKLFALQTEKNKVEADLQAAFETVRVLKRRSERLAKVIANMGNLTDEEFAKAADEALAPPAEPKAEAKAK